MTPDFTAAVRPPEHIVYGTDFSDAAARVLPRVLELAEACGADVEVVHVLDDSYRGPEAERARALKKGVARSRLEHMRMAYTYGFTGRRQVRLTRAIVLARDPIEGMIDVIRRRPRSLVALGTHGASGAARQRLGRVTTQLLHQTAGPALIVPTADILAKRVRTIVAVQTMHSGVQSQTLLTGRALANSLEAALESILLQPARAAATRDDGHRETVSVVETVTPDPAAQATWVEAVLRAASGLGADLVVTPRRLVLTRTVTHEAFAVALASSAACCLLVV